MNPEFLQRVADAFTLAPDHDIDVHGAYFVLIVVSLLIGIVSALWLSMKAPDKTDRIRRNTVVLCSALILASIIGTTIGAGYVFVVRTQHDTDDPKNRAGGYQSIALSQELDRAMIQRLRAKYDIKNVTLYTTPQVQHNEDGSCIDKQSYKTVTCPTDTDVYQSDGDPRLSTVLLDEIKDSGQLPTHDISRKVNVTVNDEERTVWVLEYQADTHDVVLHNNQAANTTITPDQRRK